MSVTRKERVARQKHRLSLEIERVKEVFDAHSQHGVTKAVLVMLAEIEEERVGLLMVELRRRATEVGGIPAVLKIGGEWIYGWAIHLHQHRQEHYKRRKNEARSLALSIETLTQSIIDEPDANDLRRQLRTATHRLEDVEAEMEEVSGQLRLLKSEVRA
jgi:hypothetical protein